jgi:hypothetical protein
VQPTRHTGLGPRNASRADFGASGWNSAWVCVEARLRAKAKRGLPQARPRYTAWGTVARPAAWLLVASISCAAGCSQVLDLDSYGPALGDDAGSDATQDSTSGTVEGSADSAAPPDQGSDAGHEAAPVGAPPSAALSASAIDFGISPCGGAAPQNRAVTISNIGGAPLVWQAALNTTQYFAIAGLAGGTVNAGASASLTLVAQSVPAFMVAGNTEQATLTITSSDPSNRTLTLAVKLVAGGGSLAVVPTSADFGQVSVGTSASPISVALTNTGNLPVTVGFVQPANAALTLGWMGAPAGVVVGPGGTVPNLVANFLPSALGSVADTAGITVSGAMCGTSPSTIGMTGTGSSSLVTVQPGILDFGSVGCGTRAHAQGVTIHNTGTASVTYTTALTTGTAYAVNPPSGSVGPGASVMVTVNPNPIPAASAVTPNGYGDTLTVTTTAAGDMPHAIVLRETAQGAILSQSTSSIAFGPASVGTTASSQFTVSNTGNASATVSFGTQTNTFSVSPQAQTVGGGSSYTPIVAFAPSTAKTYSDTAIMSVAPGAVLCGPLPAGAALSGSGFNTTAVSVAPTNLDFGLVGCGSTAMPQTVSIQNSGTASLMWNAKVSTPYYSSNPGGGSLAPGASASVTVTPAAIPANSAVKPDLYADTLTFTTNAPGDMPHAVSLHETAQGAILSFNPNMLNVGQVQIGHSTQSSFEIVNNGNLTAPVMLSLMGGQYFQLGQTSVNVAGAGSASMVTVTFAPQSGGMQNATVSVSTSTPLCSPLPHPLQLSGKVGSDQGGG